MFDHFSDDFLTTDLRKLVERPQDADRLFGQALILQQAVQHKPVVDSNCEPVEPNAIHQIVNDQQGFDVGGVGLRANRVEVTLHELAVATLLRVLAAPDSADVIPLERSAQRLSVLRGKACQRNGQIKTQGNIAIAVILKTVELLVGLIAAFAEQDFCVFERRRIDRAESVTAVHGPRGIDQRLARDHRIRKIVPESLEGPGFDQVAHNRGPLSQKMPNGNAEVSLFAAGIPGR